jgi:hypothetical protein
VISRLLLSFNLTRESLVDFIANIRVLKQLQVAHEFHNWRVNEYVLDLYDSLVKNEAVYQCTANKVMHTIMSSSSLLS